MPYIEALCHYEEVKEVCVIVPRITYGHRANLGWPESWTKSVGKLRILLTPSDEEVRALLGGSNSRDKRETRRIVALFSGISAFPEVKHWFVLSLSFKNIQRGIITEAPFAKGKRWLLWLHRVRFLLTDYRYIKHVQYVFAIGEDCVKYYQQWSSRWTVVPFMYCTRSVAPDNNFRLTEEEGSRLKILFVGSLEPRKNVQVLLDALKDVQFDYSLSVIGDGELRTDLELQAKKNGINAIFEGTQPNDRIHDIMANHDLLVLPSIHDGWGAVVNEAAMVGTLTCCSDRCGARMISNYVFDVDKPEYLSRLLSQVSSDLKNLRKGREDRMRWAEKNISSRALSNRMLCALLKSVDKIGKIEK